MKTFKALTLFSILSIAFVASAFAGGDAWMTDFEAAKAKAAAENKPMLLDFTGSDWCGWCIKLDREVFSQAAFKEYADASLVLVELDFPSKKIEQSEELVKQNQALAKKYGIRGYPTILILSPDGKLVEKTGYQRGGAEAYVEHIKEIVGKI
ncbi:MAG: thioredoxin family protein [Opitutales bacterium]|jgi:protein disulfide-isomerase|nr:thioredoxin family protein [Opitutales bacterium]MDP4642921.1 thioredoxin family protein [Opitutales bacterium]MDP4776609.1 thioredoxin family protein [Opitutales bacterium]MDP4882771.1 thioredoxin family protein [Opitutales bacterium]MDP5079002.1 thioredoxin family protein [Opitutales bacterium]